MLELRAIERKLGAPVGDESRYAKIYNYLRINEHRMVSRNGSQYASELKKKMDSLEKESKKKMASLQTDF